MNAPQKLDDGAETNHAADAMRYQLETLEQLRDAEGHNGPHWWAWLVLVPLAALAVWWLA